MYRQKYHSMQSRFSRTMLTSWPRLMTSTPSTSRCPPGRRTFLQQAETSAQDNSASMAKLSSPSSQSAALSPTLVSPKVPVRYAIISALSVMMSLEVLRESKSSRWRCFSKLKSENVISKRNCDLNKVLPNDRWRSLYQSSFIPRRMRVGGSESQFKTGRSATFALFLPNEWCT